MNVYVSGRIKDVPEHPEHFARGCAIVEQMGRDAISPLDIVHDHGGTYEEFMRYDLKALLDCDAIFMLDGWERSVGARTEHMVAAVCGLETMYERLDG